MSGKIFISYRREDSRGAAGRIYDRLETHFGHDKLFMDVDTIQPGVDFVNAIEEAVNTTDIFLVVIGPDWLDFIDNTGNRRIDNPDDFVRLEVSSALRRNVRVIPVLVDKATMPRSIDLPEDLQSLSRRHAIEISHTRFSMDAERLIRSIELAFSQIGIKETAKENKVVKKPKQKTQWTKRLAQVFTKSEKKGQDYRSSSNTIGSTVTICAIGGAMGFLVGTILYFLYYYFTDVGWRFSVNSLIRHSQIADVYGPRLMVTFLNGLFYGALAGLLLVVVFRKKIQTTWWVQFILGLSYIILRIVNEYHLGSRFKFSFEPNYLYTITQVYYLFFVIIVIAVIHWVGTLIRRKN